MEEPDNISVICSVNAPVAYSSLAGVRSLSPIRMAGKGVDAIILNANGYNATARQILESLRQYATVTPEKGMWWQQLEHKPLTDLVDSRVTGIGQGKCVKDYSRASCTARVLDMFGDLNRLGWLPENGKLNTMIENALAYYVQSRDNHASAPRPRRLRISPKRSQRCAGCYIPRQEHCGPIYRRGADPLAGYPVGAGCR